MVIPAKDLVAAATAQVENLTDEEVATPLQHEVLGPSWAAQLGRTELTAVQASARRGELAIDVRGDRVLVGGHAIIMSAGQLTARFLSELRPASSGV